MAAPLAGSWAPNPEPVSAQPAFPIVSQGGQCSVHEKVTRLGQWWEANARLTAAAPEQTRVAPDDVQFKIEAMRLQFGVEAAGDRKWRLILRDSLQRTLAVLAAEDFVDDKGVGSDRWTGILRTPVIIVQLQDADPSVRVRLKAGLALPDIANEAVYSIPDNVPKWRNLHDAQLLNQPAQRAGEAVAMIQTGAYNGTEKSSWCCSGVMVAPDLLLTNWHCGAPTGLDPDKTWDEACQNAIIDLAWDGGRTRRQLSCKGVVKVDEALDYALLRVQPALGDGASDRVIPARISRIAPKASDNIYLIHHPQCQAKQISLGCRVQDPAYSGWTDPAGIGSHPDLTHNCATETGSSGGAVFNGAGALVALHHAGFDRAGICVHEDKVNKAVRITEIVNGLPAAERARLRFTD